MEHITLFYRQGSSDKTYQASIMPKDGGYVVPVKDAVRRAEAVEIGDVVTVRLRVDV